MRSRSGPVGLHHAVSIMVETAAATDRRALLRMIRTLPDAGLILNQLRLGGHFAAFIYDSNAECAYIVGSDGTTARCVAVGPISEAEADAVRDAYGRRGLVREISREAMTAAVVEATGRPVTRPN